MMTGGDRKWWKDGEEEMRPRPQGEEVRAKEWRKIGRGDEESRDRE